MLLRDLRDTLCPLFPIIIALMVGHVFSQQLVQNLSTPTNETDPIVIQTSDSCDWSGSGLESTAGRSIVPVYLRCLQGTIHWRYPENGLRVLLSNPDREFRGCIRIRRSSTRHRVVANVRVAVEEERGQSLRSLYHPTDGQDPDLLRCFSSRNKEVVLFIESIPTHNSPIAESYQKESVFELDYHLEPVESEKALSKELDECRPCSDEELVHSFCASDFLIKGSIRSMLQNEFLSRSEIIVDIGSIVRDSGVPSLSEGESAKSVTLHRPLKCHSRSGMGSTSEFLFMGRWLLGNPVIRCAPKYSSWKHVRHRALQSGSSSCRL